MLKLMSNTIQAVGSSLSLPAHGRAGARATSSLAAHFAKRNTKFGGGGKARAGKNSFPPTPFLFARPSENYQNSASGFSRKKVRISFRTDSQLVKFWFPASLGAEFTPHTACCCAGPLASANEFSSNFQTSQSFFARRANAKQQFSAQKRLQIKQIKLW